MRIAQVAPLHESVPPKAYGGTERVVSLLTECLVKAGHDVTLYATADSQTTARLEGCRPRSLRGDPSCIAPLAPHFLMFEKLLQRAGEYDVIHFHTDYLHFPFAPRFPIPHLTTLHGRLDIPEIQEVLREYQDLPLVSISNSQRWPAPQANWIGTVYHGIGRDEVALSRPENGYLAFLGRISPEKRPDKAIEIARRAGISIKLAAKVDPVDREYFAEVVLPLLDGDQASFIGEVGPRRKRAFLQGATALLFPIDWPEPFGLVMIEAMGCGTPVVAWNRGSVPEVVDEGITGFVVDNDEDALAAVQRCQEFDRSRCRAHFEKRFAAERMAAEYLGLYERQIRFFSASETYGNAHATDATGAVA